MSRLSSFGSVGAEAKEHRLLLVNLKAGEQTRIQNMSTFLRERPLGPFEQKKVWIQDLPTGHHLRRPKSTKASRGDLLEGAGTFLSIKGSVIYIPDSVPEDGIHYVVSPAPWGRRGHAQFTPGPRPDLKRTNRFHCKAETDKAQKTKKV